MARPETTFELQCWRCEEVVEFPTTARHACPKCGVTFQIDRPAGPILQPKPETQDDLYTGKPAESSTVTSHSIESGELWSMANPELEFMPGVRALTGAIA